MWWGRRNSCAECPPGTSAGVEEAALETTNADVEKLRQPCFEGCLEGSWREVNILEWPSDSTCVRYLPNGEQARVSLNHLRLRARNCDDWDCVHLRVGADVSVYGRDPQAPTTRALYDAQIVSVAKPEHEIARRPACRCNFSVKYFSIDRDPFAGAERSLLEGDPDVVGLSSLRLLQRPGITPLHDVIEVHMSRERDYSKHGRWSHDTYLLKDTQLRLMTLPRGGIQQSLACPAVKSDTGNVNGGEQVSAKEGKPNVGLLPSWNPDPEDSQSDSEMMTEEKKQMLQRFYDFDLAKTSDVIEQAELPNGVNVQDVGESDGAVKNTECKHVCSFDDSLGLVCDRCGIVTVRIEELIPEVDWSRPRSRQTDLDDWNFGKRSPDANQGATGHHQVKNEEVTMLSPCLPPHYAQQMHPHQRDGFEFLWRSLAHLEQGELRMSKVDKNAGCILAHAPGTGKSFLIIAFLKSYMDMFPSCRPLIVAPNIMLLCWQEEFSRWKSDIKVFILNTAAVNERNAMLSKWKSKRSVCLVSYNLFQSLVDEKSNRDKEAQKSLLESSSVLILDEGHLPRNRNTRIRKALMKVQTNARILLSGTLFQNNFEELFNVLYLVRPCFFKAFSTCKPSGKEYVGKKEIVTEAAEKKASRVFIEEIGTKIEEGQLCKESKVLHHGLQRLHTLTADFVHHHSGEVLNSLPGLRDFGILLKPTSLQRTLLALVERRFQRPDEYLKRQIAVSEGGIHPYLLKKVEFFEGNVLNSLDGDVSRSDLAAMGKEPTNPDDGVKTKFVLDLLRSLESTAEKALIFSCYIAPLELLEDMFKAAFNWDKNKEVLRLDGKMAPIDREAVIKRFNGTPYEQAPVLLASTKACGEGISLVGASRVVFLDVLWNPAVFQQAISRAFRLGQKRTVFVYRLIALGTIEEKIYKKAIRKSWLSKMIYSPAASQVDISLDQPEESSRLKNVNLAEVLAWEVDAKACEDDVLEKLLNSDKSQTNSFSKVVEHGPQLHNRKTLGCPDARDWFLDVEDYADLSHVRERREGEVGMDNTNPEYDSSSDADWEF